MILGRYLGKALMWVTNIGNSHDLEQHLLVHIKSQYLPNEPIYVFRSIIFTNGTEELRLAAVSKEREQTVSKSSIVTTQIQQLGKFCPAEPEHQVW